ncbi:hypothetical protein EH207_17265 [Brenneria rubrifaciens]|uniref:VENN motif-containing domain-containing protein n=1 Tax=Brenneria rubrifaciens TaxID=55213 RepID=A0A4P8R0I6_9GAMM|nr:hypothetical protein EH207_17265 [Brenneria rubrifaciens]
MAEQPDTGGIPITTPSGRDLKKCVELKRVYLQTQRSEQNTAQGSSLTAGDDLRISATGQDGDLTVKGSRLSAGDNVLLAANRDINLLSAENTRQLDGKNESRGGSVGVGIGVGSGGWGISVSASVNKGKGSESGNGVTHTETTVDAGRRVTLLSGRDTALSGAQVSGETVKADVGRNLTMTSEQDSDRYDAKQQNAGAGGSFTFGSMSGSASVNLSRDKMHSDYDSVVEQTGIFAGKGGFDVTVGEHTRLDGAVMGSTAAPDKNRLDTGTLGFSDIENRADYKAEHQSIGISTGGGIGSQFAGNMANGLLAGADSEGHDSTTTRSAVSEGTMVIRDGANQQQDINQLSRDVAHANQTLSPIFDKEKEQNRLQQAQLIGEIGNQVADIARTEGSIQATKAAKETYPDYTAGQLRETDIYKAEMQKYGTGSAVQRAIQAATAAVQGLAGGDMQAAIAGGAAPYIANVIARTIPENNMTGRVLAHATVNAALAAMQGKDGAAAAGAATGELMGMIATEAYGKKVGELSEDEKQTISALATLASGLAGGLAGDSSASVLAGAQSGKTTVENNYLSDTDITDFTEKYANAKTDAEKEQLLADLKKKDAAQQQQAETTGISVADQKEELVKLRVLMDSSECNAQCRELVSYSISELEPVANNQQLHKDNLNKGILAGVIYALTVEKPMSGSSTSGLSSLTKEQQQLIRNAEYITTAKGIQNPFPRDLNEKVLWNGVKANPSAGDVLKGMNKDPRFPASAGFQKMQVTHELPDGSNITIHYQYNSNTGKAYDMKMVTPQANPLQPGPSLKGK